MASITNLLQTHHQPLRSSTASRRRPLCHRVATRITCKAPRADGDSNLERRQVLLGLGGLYGASSAGMALGAPIQTPPLTSCGISDVNLNCCPPASQNVVDFVLPPAPATLRVRHPAHLVDTAYVAKYEKAVSLMKALPASDPRNFRQQANVHCAYCDAAYDQVGFPNVEIQVHSSWFFLPWHRFYLYFHERILGKLIGDDNFALPYWNWDAPAGMTIPAIFAKKTSPLYDAKRDSSHQPPVLVDLDYGDTDGGTTQSNLSVMYRQMVTNAKTQELFFGSPYRAGDEPSPGAGSIEQVPHGPVHVWTGRPSGAGEDMGVLYSAARDPIFYSHHSNVDRMWSLWKGLSPDNQDITDPDYLNASFYLYDENQQLVRVRIKDALDTARLGYTYQQVDLPWLQSPPISLATSTTEKLESIRSRKKKRQQTGAPPEPVTPEPTFPLVLSSPVTVTVKRPKPSRSEDEKSREEEVLVVYGIEFDRTKVVKFDVYVEAEEDYEELGPTACEKAGSFVNVPHKSHKNKDGTAMVMKIKTRLKLGLADLLALRDAEGQESLKVTLVPRRGKGDVTIAGVAVEFSKSTL